MRQLIYVSAGHRRDMRADVEGILAAARRNNARNGVTGVLLYSGGAFLQVLEGEGDAVEATFQRISRDPRHGSVTIVGDWEIADRSFANWSMGWRELGESDPLAGAVRSIRAADDAVTSNDQMVDEIIRSFMENSGG